MPTIAVAHGRTCMTKLKTWATSGSMAWSFLPIWSAEAVDFVRQSLRWVCGDALQHFQPFLEARDGILQILVLGCQRFRLVVTGLHRVDRISPIVRQRIAVLGADRRRD